MLIIAICLAALGACVGSFISALTWRLKFHKDWVRGRSQCPQCGHRLQASELVPVLSWLWLHGRCRHCRRPISKLYLGMELASIAVFTGSYYWWPGGLHSSGDRFLLVGWLAVAVGLLALAVYDLRWRLLPNKLLYPTAVLAIAVRLIYVLWFTTAPAHAFGAWALSVLVASGIFWVIYHLSGGRLIGYGDVRLGIITGTVLATPALSLFMIFSASVLGTLAALPQLVTGRQSLRSKIAYGPFLIVATALSLLFGNSLIHWYRHFLN